MRRLLLRLLRPQVWRILDALQFAYEEKVSIKDSSLYLLLQTYSHLDMGCGTDRISVCPGSQITLLSNSSICWGPRERTLEQHKGLYFLLSRRNRRKSTGALWKTSLDGVCPTSCSCIYQRPTRYWWTSIGRGHSWHHEWSLMWRSSGPINTLHLRLDDKRN